MTRTAIACCALICADSAAAADRVVVELKDVVYSQADPAKCRLDFYGFDDAESVPVILLVHGGGWAKGDKSSFARMSRDLRAEGFAVVNVNYRLSGDAPFPAAVHDLKAAIRWVRAHADEYGLDSDRVVGAGFSAGGHLVAMAATTAGKLESKDDWPDQPSHLNAAIVSGAGVDQVSRIKESKTGEIPNCTVFFGGTYAEFPERYRAGSPITHVSAETAPFLFLDGGRDKPGTRYVGMVKKLDAAEVAHELHVISDAKHGQWGQAVYRPMFVKAIADYARRVPR